MRESTCCEAAVSVGQGHTWGSRERSRKVITGFPREGGCHGDSDVHRVTHVMEMREDGKEPVRGRADATNTSCMLFPERPRAEAEREAEPEHRTQ